MLNLPSQFLYQAKAFYILISLFGATQFMEKDGFELVVNSNL